VRNRHGISKYYSDKLLCREKETKKVGAKKRIGKDRIERK